MSPSLAPPFVIKVCGVTNVEDALIAIEAGVNAIGLNFYPSSPRFISPEVARSIVSHLPDSVLKVGVFVEPSAEDLAGMIRSVSLDVIQLHGHRVPPFAHRTWRALTAAADPAESLAAEAILLDSASPQHGGSGKNFDWSLAARFWQPVIIAGGLDASNVALAIETAHPWGVDACSRLEQSRGKKDPAKVRDFVAAARAASHTLEKVIS